ncbi:MAG: hypothetical protein QOJ97_242 [Solirubrobacteraceae bacterium]|jgi:hypothetical protein|nr:hypothetical protein [Solirubrobacteraceae bacterium]
MVTCLLLGAAAGAGVGFLVGWPVSGGIIGLTFGFLVALAVVARRFRRL